MGVIWGEASDLKPGRARQRELRPSGGRVIQYGMVRDRRGGWPAESGLATFVTMFEAAGMLDELNDEQRGAATHGDGPLLVLAGAGTGKTGTPVAPAARPPAAGAEGDRAPPPTG